LPKFVTSQIFETPEEKKAEPFVFTKFGFNKTVD